MNQKLEQYLSRKEQEQRSVRERRKQELLLKEGLYDVQYLDEWRADAGYDNNREKYFIRVPIEISDEEYQLLKEISKSSNNDFDEEDIDNKIATTLTVIAVVIYLGGFFAGVILGNVEVVRGTYYTYTDTEFSFAVALAYWAVSLISGTMFLGFAEIIKLLDSIKRK